MRASRAAIRYPPFRNTRGAWRLAGKRPEQDDRFWGPLSPLRHGEAAPGPKRSSV